MIRIGPPIPVPNQSAANGTQAIGAMKRKPSKIGVTMSSSRRNQPIGEAERNADDGGEQHAVEEAQEARAEVLRQGAAGERRSVKRWRSGTRPRREQAGTGCGTMPRQGKRLPEPDEGGKTERAEPDGFGAAEELAVHHLAGFACG